MPQSRSLALRDRSLCTTTFPDRITMAQSGIFLALTVFLAALDYGLCVRCHQCNSQSDPACMDPYPTVNSQHLVDCSASGALDYNRNFLHGILPQQFTGNSYVANAPRYCAKLVFQSGTVVRTCLDANPVEPLQTCRIMERASNEFPQSRNQIKHCSVCERDFCNGAGALTASLPIAFVALVASYLYYQ